MLRLHLDAIRELQRRFLAYETIRLYISKYLEDRVRDLPGFIADEYSLFATEGFLDEYQKEFGPRLTIGRIERCQVSLVEWGYPPQECDIPEMIEEYRTRYRRFIHQIAAQSLLDTSRIIRAEVYYDIYQLDR